MRFKKGSKVEVFSNKEVPFGAWRFAEIISGNGHSYIVRYASLACAKGDAIGERVSRKKLRPFPPNLGVERWGIGELVEVFDDLFWKIATVLKDIDGNYYLVRLLGVPREFSVQKVNIRVRQSWQDDKWFVIGKVSGSVKSTRMSESDVYQKPQTDATLEVLPGDYSLALQNNTSHHESNVVPARLLKRASPFSASEYAESCTGNPRKIRSIEEREDRKQWSSVQKVEAVAYPQKTLGKIHMHASFYNYTNGYCEMVRVKSNHFNECIHSETSEANDYCDTDTCSVGSCSVISYDENKMQSRVLEGSNEDADLLSSDAESFCGREEEEMWSCSVAGVEAARSHRFELDTYRNTLEALFASGPLSWEQEASLTDLRLSLNVSDDEHLMELRNLIASGTSNHVS